MRRIVAILFAVTLLLVGLACLADPTIRYPYIGVQLQRELDTLGGTDPLTVILSVEDGTEMLPDDLLDEEPATQDQYSLLMVLREEVRPQSNSAIVSYDVEQMESEQWAWQEVELNKLKARTEIFPSAGALAPTLTFPKKSVMASNEVWTPLITSLWPKLPEGFVKAGKASWQEQLSLEESHPITGEKVKVHYNLVYRLDKFVNTERGLLANVLLLGTIDESSEVDPTIDVQGTIKGFVLLEPSTGRAYGGEYRVEEQFRILQPNLPVFRKNTFQGAKFWRPMFYKMSEAKPQAGLTPNPTNEEKPSSGTTNTTHDNSSKR